MANEVIENNVTTKTTLSDYEKFLNLSNKITELINNQSINTQSTNALSDYSTSYSTNGEGSHKFSTEVLYTSENAFVKSLGFEKIAFPGSNATILNKFMISADGVQHCGVDFRAENGTNLYAVCDGVLTKTMNEFNGMLLTASNGIKFRYLHCDTTKLNDKGVNSLEVKCGDIIGTAGSTDKLEENVTIYPHLHFDIFFDTPITNKYFVIDSGMVQDPEEFFYRADMVLVNKII